MEQVTKLLGYLNYHGHSEQPTNTFVWSCDYFWHDKKAGDCLAEQTTCHNYQRLESRVEYGIHLNRAVDSQIPNDTTMAEAMANIKIQVQVSIIIMANANVVM